MAAPAELKVKASTAAAAASGLVLFVLGRYVFKGAVPGVAASWVYVLVPSLVTFAAGYAARHTARPPPPAVPPQSGGAGGGGEYASDWTDTSGGTPC